MSRPPAPEKSSILIVDDREEHLVALEAVLGPLGERLVSVRSGEEALKAMLRQEFAVVLLDVLMPGMDGFETAGNIKRLDQTKDVPIILLTGTDVDTDYAYRGYALGVADFLSKPIDPWVLRTKVNVFLDLHRKNHQLAEQEKQLRDLLAGNRASGAGDGAAGETSARSAATAPWPWGQPGARGAEDSGTGRDAEQLAQITEKLARIESLVRDSDGPRATELSGHLAELTAMIRALEPAAGD